MVVVMSSDSTPEHLQAIIDRVEDAGGKAYITRGVERTILGLVGDLDLFSSLNLEGMPGVSEVVRISVPYKLVSREHHHGRSTVMVGVGATAVPIGPDTVTVVAGPCAVETHDQTLAAAWMARACGASILRGGAYKPRTSPYGFQGLGEQGLEILAEVGRTTGLPTVTEVVDPRDAALVASYADMLQVGTRNAQNFALLQAVGEVGKPVLLKRGMTSTIDEWLMAAEYIAQRGNSSIVLCERGIRTYETATRNTLDVSAVPMVQSLSHLPVVIDPSHAGGKRGLVIPLSKAAIAVGADGILVDVHPDPERALCDGPQALTRSDIDQLAMACRDFAACAGRHLVPAPATAEAVTTRV